MAERETKVDVTELLRSDLLLGEYQPRERLVENDLAERYGVNRSSVRSAITTLTNEGLLEKTHNRGARVRPYTVREVIEEYDVRQVLQGMLAARAAALGTTEEREELATLLGELRAAVTGDDLDALYRANLALRRQIRTMARHATATDILEQFEQRRIQRFFPHFLPERRVEALRDQEDTIAAVIAGDADRARVLEEHRVGGTVEALKAQLESRGKAPGDPLGY